VDHKLRGFMAINNSQNALFGTELSATMSGSAVLIGSMPVTGAILIFDNQGTEPVGIYVNGTVAANLWRTFPAGEALTLDLRAAQGKAPNFGNAVNTTFYGLGASGTFSISYVYAQDM
jgi:hypothetical protein